MIKVMIVDDEKNFRDYLKMSIDWKSYGFTLCCEAKNGIEALEKARVHEPDIMLLDINMPKMDGLSLTEKLREEGHDISTIFITGYDRFEYAQRAIKLGAYDYILKPFESSELVLIMLKLKNNIMKAYEETIESSNQAELIRNLYINQYLTKQYEVNEEDHIKRLDKWHIRLNHVLVTVIEIDQREKMWNNEEDKILWEFAVKNILHEVVEPDGNHIILSDQHKRILSIIDFSHTPNMEEIMQDYIRFKRLIHKYLDFTVTIGVGNVNQGYEGMRDAYRQGLEALHHKYKLGVNALYMYENMEKGHNRLKFYSVDWNEELLTYMRANDQENNRKIMEKIFKFTNTEDISMENMRIIHYVIISLCLSYIAQTNRSATDIFGQCNNPYEEIDCRETAAEQQQWLMDFIDCIMTYYKHNQTTRSSQIANEVKDYIHNHYMNIELTIRDIVGHVYMNETYVRKMFVKEMGVSLNEYITQVRMGKAKELILSKGVKITDIAELVGYSYPGYFSRCFKKFYGISPSQYELLNTNFE